MHSIYGILFGTLFVVFNRASFLDQAIARPDNTQALYNAGTDFYLNDDNNKAPYFLEHAKKNCAHNEKDDLKLAENISLNLAHSLVKAEKYQEALNEYKELYEKFQNPKAAKNIPILEKFLQRQQQQNQDKQDQDNQDQQKDQNSNQNNQQDQDNQDQQEQSRDDFDNQQKQKKDQQKSDQKKSDEQKFDQENKDKKQQDKPEDSKHKQSPAKDQINSNGKANDKVKNKNQQPLDKDEQALLQAIENFDQDMMKMYAAANCGGNDEDGW